MPDVITIADDADLAHLVDMLPDPQNTGFWGDGDYSIASKIGHHLRAVLNGRAYPKDVDYLAVHVLKYLGRGNGHIPEERIAKNLTGAHGIRSARCPCPAGARPTGPQRSSGAPRLQRSR
ncbi:hypothetical protein [Kitasatospora sp. NPDC001132]